MEDLQTGLTQPKGPSQDDINKFFNIYEQNLAPDGLPLKSLIQTDELRSKIDTINIEWGKGKLLINADGTINIGNVFHIYDDLDSESLNNGNSFMHGTTNKRALEMTSGNPIEFYYHKSKLDHSIHFTTSDDYVTDYSKGSIVVGTIKKRYRIGTILWRALDVMLPLRTNTIVEEILGPNANKDDIKYFQKEAVRRWILRFLDIEADPNNLYTIVVRNTESMNYSILK